MANRKKTFRKKNQNKSTRSKSNRKRKTNKRTIRKIMGGTELNKETYYYFTNRTFNRSIYEEQSCEDYYIPYEYNEFLKFNIVNRMHRLVTSRTINGDCTEGSNVENSIDFESENDFKNKLLIFIPKENATGFFTKNPSYGKEPFLKVQPNKEELNNMLTSINLYSVII